MAARSICAPVSDTFDLDQREKLCRSIAEAHMTLHSAARKRSAHIFTDERGDVSAETPFVLLRR
jgi:hypothetical protein